MYGERSESRAKESGRYGGDANIGVRGHGCDVACDGHSNTYS